MSAPTVSKTVSPPSCLRAFCAPLSSLQHSHAVSDGSIGDRAKIRHVINAISPRTGAGQNGHEFDSTDDIELADSEGVSQMEELTVIVVKKRYSAVTWKERIDACRGSGQSVAE